LEFKFNKEKTMGDKVNLGVLLSVNHSVVLAAGDASSPADAFSDCSDRNLGPGERNHHSTGTIENMKRMRALRCGILPAMLRKAGVRSLSSLKTILF
jgi:hypothetical protein